MADPIQQPAVIASNAESPRMLALKNLAKNLPVANSQVAQGQVAARNMQLQQAVAAAPASTNATATGQQVGAQQAQQAGAQQVEQAQKTTAIRGPLARIGTAANQEQQQQGEQKVQGLQQGAKQQEMDNAAKFAQVSEQAKKEYYDDQLQFERDENGRETMNTIQMSDWTRLKAQNAQDLQNKEQAAKQLLDRNLQMMQTAYDNVKEDLDQKYKLAKQSGDEQAAKEIQVMQQQAADRMAREKSRHDNGVGAWSTGGTIVGTAVGAYFGGAAGAQAGGSMGGAVGGAVGESNSSGE